MSCRAKSWRKQIFRLNICHFKVSLDECWRSYEWAGIVVGKWKSRNFDDDYVCCSGLKGSLSHISLSYKIVLKIPLAREILYCTMTLIKSSTNVYDLYFSLSAAAMWGICQGLVERCILCLEDEKMLCHVKMNVIRLDPAELRAVNPIDRYQSFTRNKRVAEILGNSTTSSYFNSYLIL